MVPAVELLAPFNSTQEDRLPNRCRSQEKICRSSTSFHAFSTNKDNLELLELVPDLEIIQSSSSFHIFLPSSLD